jgi:Tfp pilus assembly protein PilE
MYRRQNRRTGFTIVEITITTTMAAILAVEKAWIDHWATYL